MHTFQPSTYQTAIFDWIDHGRGDAMVNAVAGSGKSTTLIHAAQRITSANAVFFAFNKHIVEELQARLLGTPMQAMTIHSLGYRCVRESIGGGQWKIDGRKYQNLAKAWLHRAMPSLRNDAKLTRHFSAIMAKIGDLLRLTLPAMPTRIAAFKIAQQYGIDVEPEMLSRLCPGIDKIIEDGIAQAYAKIIDYTDMVWLPHKLELQPPTFDWVFVDEAQDLNAAQRELVLKCRAAGGRMLFVGDERQAIMAFAGADAESYRTIRERLDATELPLSICYRCPKDHIDLAKTIVPHIEARPDAPDGIIEHIPEEQLGGIVREGDLILCRMTAPLVTWCIKLISQKIPARVRGRDVAKQLTDLARTLADNGPYSDLGKFINAYELSQLEYLTNEDASEEQLTALSDKCEALRTCFHSFQATDVDGLCAQIDGLFSDERASVWLSTIHRAKGLEAARVVLLKPEKVPLIWSGQRPDELLQEHNLRYVALTRSTNTLIMLESPPKEADDDE